MKVIKEKSREYKGKIYYKYKININEDVLKNAGITEGDELEYQSKQGKLILKKIKHKE